MITKIGVRAHGRAGLSGGAKRRPTYGVRCLTGEIVVPTVSNEEADKLFPKGYKQLKPYLRITPQPNL